MRYCSHCERFNPGRPQFCHFCGRTWYVRLCPRGHENPAHVQYCGACGSADLTETAGPRPLAFIAIKVTLWAILGLAVYSTLLSLLDLINSPTIYRILSFIIAISLFIFGFQLALSVMPRAIGNGVRRVAYWGIKGVGKMFMWFLKNLWEILKI